MRQGRHGGDLFVAFEDAALQFEILKSIPVVRRLCEPDNGRRRQYFLIAQPKPFVRCVGGAAIWQICPLSITDVEQIPEHLDGCTLLPLSKERG